MLQILTAKVEDKEALQDIYAAAVGDQSTLDDQHLEQLIKTDGLLIASTEGVIFAFGAIDLTSQEQVKWIYCLPAHQRTGIGSQLLQRLEEIGWQAGLTTLRVHSAPGAVKFYQRHGYEAVEQDQHTHDHDGVEMIKHLPVTSRGEVSP